MGVAFIVGLMISLIVGKHVGINVTALLVLVVMWYVSTKLLMMGLYGFTIGTLIKPFVKSL